MPTPDRIKQLVETFEQNINDYRFNKNETELRRQFLDPFFEALGWDVDNKQGKDERHKEVAHEFSVEIDGQQKKADYAFRTEKDIFDFLVEAKKPSVNVESNKDAAFQIRSYGWSAKLPVNILTDFEHLAIYDCRIRPNYAKDDAKTGRIDIIHYKDYLTRWDELVKLFSPDAIRNGGLNEYTDGLKTKKGTQEVDDAFLEEIEGWREALAKNIASRNKDKNLNEDQINFAVQMTIDRIVFLRICEDRGIEREKQLFELLNINPLPASPKFDNKNLGKKEKDSMSNLGEVPKAEGAGTGTSVYEALRQLFEKADDRYNSGLFHFKKDKERENPDTLSGSLEIDDKVLKDIIKDLYYPSPYAFTYIPTEILGSVYERFLGKVIRLTAGGNAKVEEKPEVRKAGGVYYTPAYIVEYIVKNTVGRLVNRNQELGIRNEGLTPDEVSKIKIVDPACGSGSFLLGAYQFLLDWHLDYYASNQTDKWVKNRVILTADNKTFRLSIDEKKRILLNNIHGVDLDPQAVEVTKLSLLLKVVEDPGQLKMFEEGHILPNLNKNIKNGNALIGTDYFSGQMFGDMEEMKRVKPFDWNTEFPEVFKRGGFDVVIGNPPWISLSGKFGSEIYSSKQIEYLIKKFSGNTYMPNMYEYFVSQGLNIVRNDGYFSFIVPDRLGFNRQFVDLRKRILNESKVDSLVYKTPFPGITADTLVFVFQKGKPDGSHLVKISEYKKIIIEQNQEDLLSSSDFIFGYFEDQNKMKLIGKIESSKIKPLKDFCESTSGYGGKSQLITENQINQKQIPTLKGESIGKYTLRKTFWFEFKKENITGRTTDKNKLGASPKILLRKTGNTIIATYDESKVFPEQSLYFLFNKKDAIDYKYLLGLLNSKVLTLYYQAKSLTNKNSIAQVKKVDLDELPIRTINFNNPTEKSKHDKMVSLVEQMLALHKSLAGVKTPQEGELIKRQITSTDKAIDSLVYELYGLNEEEIGIVES